MPLSPLARGRGLKPPPPHPARPGSQTAPRAGAWIETRARPPPPDRGRSPLARGRGLKLASDAPGPGVLLSPLARGRGLKLEPTHVLRPDLHIAPRAGAWIETASRGTHAPSACIAPRAGAWIETGGSCPP